MITVESFWDMVRGDPNACPEFFDESCNVCLNCDFRKVCERDSNDEIQQKRASSDDVFGNEDY